MPHLVLSGIGSDDSSGNSNNQIKTLNKSGREGNIRSKRKATENEDRPCRRKYYPSDTEFIGAICNNNHITPSGSKSSQRVVNEMVKVKKEEQTSVTISVDVVNSGRDEVEGHCSSSLFEPMRVISDSDGHTNLVGTSPESDSDRHSSVNDQNNRSKNASSPEENNDTETDEGNDETSELSTTEIPTLFTYQPREPSYDKANSIPFSLLCKRFETLWKQRKVSSKKKVSTLEKLKYLLPDSLKEYLAGGSPYPLLRLVLPDHDSCRPHTGLKEATVGKVWGGALGLWKNSTTYKKLIKFNDPAHVSPNAVGDLSVVVQEVMQERYSGKGSKLTLGEVNDWLDVLVDIVKDRFGNMASETVSGGSSVSGWKLMLESEIGVEKGMEGQIKEGNKSQKYVKLVEKLIEQNLSVSEVVLMQSFSFHFLLIFEFVSCLEHPMSPKIV